MKNILLAGAVLAASISPIEALPNTASPSSESLISASFATASLSLASLTSASFASISPSSASLTSAPNTRQIPANESVVSAESVQTAEQAQTPASHPNQALTDSLLRFFAYQNATMQEKLYISTDRPYYEAGDTIWFRGTLVKADNHSLVVKSNYIYVELYNSSGQKILRRKVLRDGLCFQHCLPLPSALASGEYSLRAYTSWMRNFDAAFFFDRKLTIVNRNEAPLADVAQQHRFGITFFPEGGPLLGGVSQRVAFKAERSDGMPEAVSGTIMNRKGETLATITTRHDGMGSFVLPAVPVGDSLYAEIVTAVDGLKQRVALPLPQEGVTLSLTGDNYQVLASPHVSLHQPMVIVVHSGSKLVQKIDVTAGTSGKLDLTGCRNGISHVVLVSADGRGLSRRLLYNNQAQTWQMGFRPEFKSKQSREPIFMNISLADAQGNPLRGDFCISVTDKMYVNDAEDDLKDNIITNLLLTSDLKGYIHEPAWYFADGTTSSEKTAASAEDRAEGLDLLMLTHGWCRFATDTLGVLPQRDFKEPLEEREWISGKVLELSKSDIHTQISVVDTVGQTFGKSRLEDDGSFFVGDLNYPDDALLHVRVLSSRKRPKYVFDRYLFPDYSFKEPFIQNFANYLATSAEKNLFVGRDGMRTQMLDDVVVTANAKKSKSMFFPNISTERYRDVDYLEANYDLYRYDNALSLVNELIEDEWSMYLDPLDAFGDFHADNAGAYGADSGASKVKATNGWGELTTFVIDEELYSGVDAAVGVLERIKSEDVERIEIIDKSENLVNPMLNSAALVVKLKPGAKPVATNIDRRIISTRAFGYTLPQYFYNPIYKTPESKVVIEMDLRKTLYWEPSFQTDNQGKAILGFYDSDHPGARHVVIEGVTFKGIPVRFEADMDNE